jgi:hypothetical protein
MKLSNRWFVLTIWVFTLLLGACAPEVPATETESKPIRVEHLNNDQAPTREILTEEAAKRLDIQTAIAAGGVGQSTVIPFSALLYDNQGDTWIYTNPEPLTFIRSRVVVDRIEGDNVILSNGLLSGTPVVTVGAAELYGSEFEFEEE